MNAVAILLRFAAFANLLPVPSNLHLPSALSVTSGIVGHSTTARRVLAVHHPALAVVVQTAEESNNSKVMLVVLGAALTFARTILVQALITPAVHARTRRWGRWGQRTVFSFSVAHWNRAQRTRWSKTG